MNPQRAVMDEPMELVVLLVSLGTDFAKLIMTAPPRQGVEQSRFSNTRKCLIEPATPFFRSGSLFRGPRGRQESPDDYRDHAA